jgi:hypothetical protein
VLNKVEVVVEHDKLELHFFIASKEVGSKENRFDWSRR